MSRCHLPAQPARRRRAATVLAAATLPFSMAACSEEEEPVEDAMEAPADAETLEDEPVEEEEPVEEDPLSLSAPFTDLGGDESRAVIVQTAEVVHVPGDEAFTIGPRSRSCSCTYSRGPGRRRAGVRAGRRAHVDGHRARGHARASDGGVLTSAGVTGDEADPIGKLAVHLAATGFELA